jgi:glycosyltransferase involved in cell wall biosynthesis
MHLDGITPMIITYNEEPNIGRVLDRLSWAKDVVVIDSFSSDRTLDIVRSYANTRVFQRAFDDFAAQCNYGLHETAIRSDWVLALDADYLVSEALVREIETLKPAPEIAGYAVNFRYCIHGRPLRRTIYPARTVLFRRGSGTFMQDGHAHRVAIEGQVSPLRATIDHDDRKPLSHWIASQDKYARMERDKLASTPVAHLSFPDKVRTRRFIAPLMVLFYCLFAKRMILDGLPGWYYTYQRVIAEILLSLYLIEQRFAAPPPGGAGPAAPGEGR